MPQRRGRPGRAGGREVGEGSPGRVPICGDPGADPTAVGLLRQEREAPEGPGQEELFEGTRKEAAAEAPALAGRVFLAEVLGVMEAGEAGETVERAGKDSPNGSPETACGVRLREPETEGTLGDYLCDEAAAAVTSGVPQARPEGHAIRG